MIFNVSGGGGTALNFRVVGNPQPENPSDNAIWINTDVPITSWIFSAEEPSPAEGGMVWITAGTSSAVAFSATKKNPIMVYPISAKQYVSGTWAAKEAKSYQNGAWVDWVRYLYSDTGIYDGTWKSYDYVQSDESPYWTGTTVSLVIGSDGIMKSSVSGTRQIGFIVNDQKIDFSKYSTVRFRASRDAASTSGAELRVIDAIKNSYTVIAYSADIGTEMVNYELDVSAISTEGYIAFNFQADGGPTTLNVESVEVA